MEEATTLSVCAHRLVRRLHNWRIGITGHLGISFAAVGALAAIANVMVEQGVSIIEITRFSAVAARPDALQQLPVWEPTGEVLFPIVSSRRSKLARLSGTPGSRLRLPRDMSEYSFSILIRALNPKERLNINHVPRPQIS
jgi:hypothetical protein